mmetsp:Transcript_1618/g.3472  ORF Transcript_1618/g.3472 Transcript_1618/m.3472 type:complete len:245 (-) Transcript_1618:1977-2711(-)
MNRHCTDQEQEKKSTERMLRWLWRHAQVTTRSKASTSSLLVMIVVRASGFGQRLLPSRTSTYVSFSNPDDKSVHGAAKISLQLRYISSKKAACTVIRPLTSASSMTVALRSRIVPLVTPTFRPSNFPSRPSLLSPSLSALPRLSLMVPKIYPKILRMNLPKAVHSSSAKVRDYIFLVWVGKSMNSRARSLLRRTLYLSILYLFRKDLKFFSYASRQIPRLVTSINVLMSTGMVLLTFSIILCTS